MVRRAKGSMDALRIDAFSRSSKPICATRVCGVKVKLDREEKEVRTIS